MKNGQSKETQDTQDVDKQNKKHNTICDGHHYMQANTYNVNKTCALPQTTGGKDEPNTGIKILHDQNSTKE